jgi:hypothetical protein
MITKFKATTYTYKITKCEFDRETKARLHKKAELYGNCQTVTVAKISHQISYFDDFESAKEWLLKQTKQEVEQARYRLKICNDNYGNVKGLKL